MTPDPYFDWAASAALGTLDGEEARRFALHVAGCLVCRRERAAFARVAALLPLGLDEVSAPAALRARVLAAAASQSVVVTLPTSRSLRAPGTTLARAPRVAWLSWAAALLLALGLGVVLTQRNAARREVVQARALASRWRDELRQHAAEREQWQLALAHERRLRALLGRVETRVARLDGRPAAPQARARVVWSAASREALLIADGLAPAPVGRTYQLWVIADAAPAPAGTFDVDAGGSALVRSSAVAATEHVRTFAVTLEPAGGRPSPSGPMILAGNVS